MGYTDEIDWLPTNLYSNNKFREIFGFTEVYNQVTDDLDQSQSAYLNWVKNPVVNIADYQHMVNLNIHSHNDSEEEINIEQDGATYKVVKSDNEAGVISIRIMNDQ